MKKRIIAHALCVLLALCLCSCSGGDKSFKITYDLGDMADVFTELPAGAKAGDTVEIKAEVLFDADIHVYVNGSEIKKSHYDSDYWGYSFTMPEKDVEVTARPYTKNEIWGI